MGVWSGLGVNYKASSTNYAADITYFNSIGLKNIRPSMPGTPTPWNSATNATWRTCATTFQAAGFWVTYGSTTGTMSASLWQAYHDSVVAEALYLQQQGIALGDYELGNELESSIQPSITTLTQTGGLATCTTSRTHGFLTGEQVTVWGAVPSGYNGTFTITVTSSTTFTYGVSSGLSTPATGTKFCYSLSLPQLNANLRQLALDVKAVYSLSPISYACWNNNVNGVLNYTDWIANGLGGLDTISIHPYGNISIANQTVADGGYVFIQQMMQAFGSKCYISEFNVDATATNLAGLNQGALAAAMEHFYRDYILPLMAPYNSKALVYMWSAFLNNGVDDFCMKLTSGSLLNTWNTLVSIGAGQTRGTASRSVPTSRQWVLGSARGSMFFGGNNVDTRIAPTNVAVLQIGATSDYTVGARVKLSPKTQSPDTDSHCIANCDLNFASNLGYEFQIQNGTNGNLRLLSGNQAFSSANGVFQYNTWQSVIFRIIGTTLDAFVQGTKIWTVTIPRPATGGSFSRFGSETTGVGTAQRRLWGNAREFFAVKSALTDTQIAAIAQNGLYPSVDVLYMLDDSTGTNAIDASGNGNTGLITGSSWSTDADSVVRTNLVTNPGLEHTPDFWWTAGNSGTTTALTHNDQDNTYSLSGTYAGMFQSNNVGQYYLMSSSAFTPTPGALYTFSAYVFVPIGTQIVTIGIGIRDFASFTYVPHADTSTTGETFFTLTPGQWTQLTYSSYAGSGGFPTWRFTIADPKDSTGTSASFTNPVSWWVDNTLLELAPYALPYFDGTSTGSFWTGTAHASTSLQPIGRGIAPKRLLTTW